MFVSNSFVKGLCLQNFQIENITVEVASTFFAKRYVICSRNIS